MFAQVHYRGSTDFDVPDETHHTIDLVKYIRKKIQTTMSHRGDKVNILVQCSSSVGKTGTFIALYKLMEELDSLVPKFENEGTDSNLSIDIFNTVFVLRSKRMQMVGSAFI